MYLFLNKNCKKYFLLVWLVGGPDESSGNVYASNPAWSAPGAVCDNGWDLNDVCLK